MIFLRRIHGQNTSAEMVRLMRGTGGEGAPAGAAASCLTMVNINVAGAYGFELTSMLAGGTPTWQSSTTRSSGRPAYGVGAGNSG